MEILKATAAQAGVKDKDGLFEEAVKEHMESIYNYARYMVLDHDEAHDVTQQTFLSLYNNLGKLDTSKSVRPWLYKVARNQSLDFLKKKKAERFSDVELEVQNIPEGDVSIESQLDSAMYLDKVKDLIKELPVEYREVMLLKYFDDFTFEQISETLDIPVNTAKSNFYRGKARLFKLLKE